MATIQSILAGVEIDDVCQVCGRRAPAPYRRVVDGRTVEGCVAKMHDRFLPRPSSSAAWASDKRFGRPRMLGVAGR